MTNKIRRHPLSCLIISLFRLLLGKLNLSNQFIGEIVEMDNNANYEIFRHITNKHIDSDAKATAFIVSFNFQNYHIRLINWPQ